MTIIKTEDNCININDALIPKNGSVVTLMAEGVRLTGVWGVMDILITGSTIDGASVESAQSMFDYFKVNSFSLGGGDGGNGVVLTNRQLIVNNSIEPGVGVAGLLTPNHWSEFEGGAPTEGQWIAAAQFDTDEQPKMGFVEVALLGDPLEFKIPLYTQNGQLPVGTPEFPENAVPLMLLDARIPQSPTTGTYSLKSVDGIVSWVEDV